MLPELQSPCDEELRSAILCRIPAFRPVAIKLMRALDDEEQSVLEVAELLKSDPALSAEVLAMANSALYGGSRAVDRIERAVMVLGTQQTRTLAAKAALFSMTRSLPGGGAVERCWLHSRATAVISAWLAPFFRIHPDRAYTAGLLHDIGRLGLLALNSGEYSRMLSHHKGNAQEQLAAEQRLFRVDHCVSGAWLMKTWGLPPEFAASASRHHESGAIIEDTLADLVRIGCAISETIGHCVAPLTTTAPLEMLLEQVPPLDHPGERYPLARLATQLNMELGGMACAENLVIH